MFMIYDVGEFHTLYRMKSSNDVDFHYVTPDIFNDAIANGNVTNDYKTATICAKTPSEIISELNNNLIYVTQQIYNYHKNILFIRKYKLIALAKIIIFSLL